MASVEYSPTLHGSVAVLSGYECLLLEPIISKEIDRVRKMYDKYLDIIESGEATERQTTICMKYEERLNSFLDIHRVIDSFNNRKI